MFFSKDFVHTLINNRHLYYAGTDLHVLTYLHNNTAVVTKILVKSVCLDVEFNYSQSIIMQASSWLCKPLTLHIDTFPTSLLTSICNKAQWINMHWNNSFINLLWLPLLCKSYGAINLAQYRFTASWQADKMQITFEF